MLGKTTFVVICGVLLLAPAAAVAQDGGCDAFAQATLERSEQGEVTSLEFEVEISTSENCAKIEYDLILDQLMPNGQTKKERLPRLVNLSDGGFMEVVRHQIPSSFSLRTYEAKVFGCVKCAGMP